MGIRKQATTPNFTRSVLIIHFRNTYITLEPENKRLFLMIDEVGEDLIDFAWIHAVLVSNFLRKYAYDQMSLTIIPYCYLFRRPYHHIELIMVVFRQRHCAAWVDSFFRRSKNSLFDRFFVERFFNSPHTQNICSFGIFSNKFLSLVTSCRALTKL